MEYYINIPIKPVGKARHRTGKTKTGKTIQYNDEKAVSDIETFIAYARPSVPKKPIEGPVRLDVTVKLPIPESWSKKKKALAHHKVIFPTGKPDVDNYCKFCCDCLNGLAWKDDAQVVSVNIAKVYTADQCGWEIFIEEMGVG